MQDKMQVQKITVEQTSGTNKCETKISRTKNSKGLGILKTNVSVRRSQQNKRVEQKVVETFQINVSATRSLWNKIAEQNISTNSLLWNRKVEKNCGRKNSKVVGTLQTNVSTKRSLWNKDVEQKFSE